jgi:hypothetical protein
MLMLALLRPRALERFFFGIAISSLYRVVESATQGIKCRPSFIAHERDARTRSRRTVGTTVRAETWAVVATQWRIRHGEQNGFAHGQSEVDLVANERFGIGRHH